MGGKGRSDNRWLMMCKQLRRDLPPVCWLCGRDIDRTLHHYDKWSWTLDHVEPLSTSPALAYTLSNLRPAHRTCNSRKGEGAMPLANKVSRRW